jgi:hypothetical protein
MVAAVPAINADPTHKLKAPDDLTLEIAARCRLVSRRGSRRSCPPAYRNSNRKPTVVIDVCHSGVPGTLFLSGCTILDLIAQIAATSRNHGRFASGVAHLGEALVANGHTCAKGRDSQLHWQSESALIVD